jgi:hypothetical protein
MAIYNVEQGVLPKFELNGLKFVPPEVFLTCIIPVDTTNPATIAKHLIKRLSQINDTHILNDATAHLSCRDFIGSVLAEGDGKFVQVTGIISLCSEFSFINLGNSKAFAFDQRDSLEPIYQVLPITPKIRLHMELRWNSSAQPAPDLAKV